MNNIPPRRQDGPWLHFYKELPDRYLLFMALVLMSGLYAALRISEILQLLIMLVGAVIALSNKKGTPTEQTIKADTIETDSVNTESMADANITTGTVTTQDKQK